MSRLRCILVEDEPPALDRLRRLLSSDPEVDIVAECPDGSAAVELISRLRPDLVFLDIQLPGKDGFEVLKELGPDLPLIVFVTAYDEYAVKAFEVNALDYLLKPFDQERVMQALARARQQQNVVQQSEFQKRVLSMLESRDTSSRRLTRILIKNAGRLAFLNVSEIDWVQAQGNYLQLHTGSASFMLRETMNGFEAQLDPEEFLRIHRGFLVRLSAIREIQQEARGSSVVILKNGTRLPLSRRYRSRLPRFAE